MSPTELRELTIAILLSAPDYGAAAPGIAEVMGRAWEAIARISPPSEVETARYDAAAQKVREQTAVDGEQATSSLT